MSRIGAFDSSDSTSPVDLAPYRDGSVFDAAFCSRPPYPGSTLGTDIETSATAGHWRCDG